MAILGVLLAVLAVASSGCATKAVALRSVPKNPLYEQLQLGARSGPKPSDRTMQLLRFYNLADAAEGDTHTLLAKLQAIADREPSAEKTYALAELSYLGARKVETSDKARALDLYGASVLHAYHYLFDEGLAVSRNPYDPQFRGACNLYNSALEGGLRIVCAKKELMPGVTKTIHTAAGEWDITCVLRGGNWRPEDFDRFEFCSDYEITGLRNHYQSHGLGVPMIAVRRSYANEPVGAKYYPVDLSFPVTAFLRPANANEAAPGQTRQQCVLELYDPLTTRAADVAQRQVPLESDLSTPLAYFLSKPEFNDLATAGLLRPETLMGLQPGKNSTIMGLYMVQPYEPGKIPVLLVHGLWSSPMTWMEMFNDLRSCPELRDNYQFWFYLYPTGQPFWMSAAQLRRDLADMRRALDPHHQEPALDQMVLVGHSMGGLLSRLQTVDSRDDYWKLVSNVPLESLKADAEVRQKMQETFYFRPNPSVRRVVTIGTPHHGSSFSNQTTQWLLGKIIQLPNTIVNSQQKVFRDNQAALAGKSILKIDTSIDSLAPDCPVFPVMLASQHLPTVRYHNIVGVVPNQWWLSRWAGDSDGVVAESSARIPGVESELLVPADHTTVHTHPAAVLEVRRILQDHLAELRGYSNLRFAAAPAGPQ